MQTAQNITKPALPQILVTRYATKKFTGETIPDKEIQELFDMIRLSPSSYNMQPWKVKVVSDKKTKELLAPAAYNQAQITSCSHLLVLCADTDLEANIDKLDKLVKSKELTAILTNFAKGLTGEKRLNWAKRQVYILLGNALIASKYMGFDSCPMEGFNAEEFSKILGLPENIMPTVLCPVGYAADQPRPKARFDKKDIFF